MPRLSQPAPPSGPLRKESFDAFADLARASLTQLEAQDETLRAGRETERQEVARALKVASKHDPKLKAELDRVAKALKRESQEDADDEERVAASVKAGLAELAKLAERHFR